MPTTRAIPTEVHYMEPVRPRNCRKDRVRENVFLANAEFDCFTEEEAPVALIVKHYGSRYDEETDEMFYECNETPYRLANGKLYTCYEILEDTDRLSLEPYSYKPNYDLETLHQDDEPFVLLGISKYLPAFDDSYAAKTYALRERMEERFRDMQGDYIMVGHGLWCEALEPAYNIVGGGWIDDRWARVMIAFQPKDEREYGYSAAEWDTVIERVQNGCSYKLDLAHEDKIEVLISEAVALPSSNEKDELNHLARAVKLMDSAGVELEGISKLDSDTAYGVADDVETRLKGKLEALAQRKQRGCGTLSEEQLEAAIESAYDDLMSRTKLTDY